MNTNRTSKAFIVRAAITLFVMLLTSATAWAESVEYIDADGQEKTQGEVSVLSNGSASTLNSGWYVIDNDIAGPLKFNGPVNLIILDNKNVTITGTDGITVNGNLTIYGQSEGTGSLSTKATADEGDGIWASGNISIIGGIITTTSYYHHGITSDSGDITITGGKVTATGENGIDASGNVTITGGKLTIDTSGDGIYVKNGGEIIINGGILTINANGYGITTYDNDITINGGIITVTATEGNGIDASGNITINGGNVTSNGNIYGIAAEGTVTLSGGIVTANDTGNTTPRAGISANKGTSTSTIYLGGAIVTASSYSGTVTVKSGVTYTKYDLTNIDVSSLNGVTIFPTTCFGIASGNDGSQGKPYTITSPEELQLLAIVVNKGITLTGKYIQLNNDLDMYGIAFRPIGVDSKFCGHFHGGDYIISNLYINIDDTCIGLFGLVDDDNAIVQNITISNATITGNEYVGGIVGSLDNGSINNCCVINSTITSTASPYNYCGAIAGNRGNSTILANNYYGNSTINDATNNVGCGTSNGSNNVTNNDGAVSATFLSESEDVPSSLNGKVVFRRVFTGGSASTICLPFAYMPNGSEGKFYTFKSVEYSEGQYIATMEEANKATSPLSANTPYLFMPAGTGTKPVLFHGDAAYASNPLTKSGYWTFKGTYEEKKWVSEPTGIYGFSAQAVADDNISQGQFVKVGAYVKIRPLRAYLEYTGSNFPNTRSSLPEEGLPDRIIVRLVGGGTSIGQLDMKTGQVNLDSGWYNLDGIRLSGKPTKHGIYVHHGKKVVISTMNNE